MRRKENRGAGILPSAIFQDQMVMEKLKSWNALSNFPTTTAAGIYVL